MRKNLLDGEAARIARRLIDDELFAERVAASLAQLLARRALARRREKLPACSGHLGAVERES